ncbi:MAG: 4a-hydroxytetrahydrobiopterin dehydratase [Verrucomicrobiaceae bacterium]|nr:4a-hydroxytetrahydrobiopterin dehydratase [Verrucomicrobiaceae bacterium]
MGRLCLMKQSALCTDAQIDSELATLEGWRIEGGRLQKQFRFNTYLDGIRFVDRVALLAEEMNHHPDLHVTWRKVEFAVSTHSAGGITALDFELARKVQALL